ncbi:hypothetical protein [Microbispora triticiradicis]|uniref:Uncharacterized protein n=2 Tax=Microbispora TaxID=2005 RepID=A0ABY3LTR8_9ACTN|nr:MULTISPECIES: hypothetical protein [Microbispora]TLP59520.1 hypothetical protein FED44_14505 [Microbispora fusca]TYB54286.1 hypothetical protein FXF59_22925 [Microbispora tritici]
MDGYRTLFALVLAAGVGLAPVSSATADPAPGWQVSLRGGAGSFVADLAATGPADAWAVGARRTGTLDPRNGSYFTAPLIKHWDGRSWATAANPAGPTGFPLREVTLVEASSPVNVWAAGTAVAPGTGDVSAATRSVLSRWDGSRWRLMGSGRTSITDLEVLDATHTWILGRDDRTGKGFFKRFRSGRWTSLPFPATLKGISVRSPGDIWGFGPSSVMRWNGLAWSRVRLPETAVPAAPTPAYGPVKLRLDALVTSGTQDVWVAAGFQQGDWSQPGAVLLHWHTGSRDGAKWHQIRLPGDVITDLAPDGRGGVLAASYRQSITATPDGQDPYAYTTLSVDSLRHTGRKLIRQTVTPLSSGFEWSDLVAIPGTGSALAAGFNRRPPQGHVVFRYDG